ncbi:phytanoyl-CoA dioxygenase family protein [Pseudanabaena sp. UWO311]|uniref:phytanoyl-CoA dioxygenase family protein n=1 Tax=Pseudanabaena sp. UWO311 TaxID=2487337 RepID=UPI001159F7D8|nr:phytanoyl-CoA dioxygenase family protein [Pseudanabaena sp. UWO311]TYQ28935.1 phytanoyl-CoA dioxygenase family protein [Pseudanabaena sp. UWO311]
MLDILFENRVSLKLKKIFSKADRFFCKLARYRHYKYLFRNKFIIDTPSEKFLSLVLELQDIEQQLIDESEKEKLRYSVFRRDFSSVLWAWACEQKIRSAHNQFYDTMIIFIEGYECYCDTGVTTSEAYYSSRQLYWITNGSFNEFWASFYGLFFPKYLLPNQVENLELIKLKDLQNVVGEIKKNGYHIFDTKLNSEISDRLVSFAEVSLCKLSPYYPELSTKEYLIYDRHNPKSVTYRIDEQELAKNLDIQNLIADFSVISMVQEYFGCRAVLRNISMWWSTDLLKGASDSSSAQLYHWDGDAIKFINIFVYLTEVTTHNGPHCFVRNSHRSKPPSLLRDGRFSDQEIEDFYGKNNIDEIVGKKGTIIAADTRAFHKGKALEDGERLILMLTFSTDLFGAPYSSIQLSDQLTDSLSISMRYSPYTYARLTLTSKAVE